MAGPLGKIATVRWNANGGKSREDVFRLEIRRSASP
jgi:hypothetical protein